MRKWGDDESMSSGLEDFVRKISFRIKFECQAREVRTSIN